MLLLRGKSTYPCCSVFPSHLYRERRWETRAGTVDVQIPKLRKRSYFPEFLEPRRASEKAMTAVTQESYMLPSHAVSWRIN
jgi:hypothetical protein